MIKMKTINSGIWITFILGLVYFWVMTGCASSSTYILELDETTTLKVSEISHPNPISPTNQYTVLWFCKKEDCKPWTLLDIVKSIS